MNYQKTFSKLPQPTGMALEAIKKAVQEKHSISNLEQLGITQRLINLLESFGVTNLEELMTKSKMELVAIPNFGEKQLYLLFSALSRYNEIED